MSDGGSIVLRILRLHLHLIGVELVRFSREEQTAERRRTNAESGDLNQELIDRWLCTSNTCSNGNAFCYVSYSGSHYRINSTQRMAWANGIVAKQYGASIETPPLPLLESLLNKQGDTAKESKNPVAKANRDAKSDRFERVVDLSIQSAEFEYN